MIQGTGSNVGKSTIVAALARAYTRRGLAVRPFKPQNMSNNAAVTVDGGEIGRAQAVQALAARVDPTVHMNPVLLKPETDTVAQLVVQGRMIGKLLASEYRTRAEFLLPFVLNSFAILEREADLVLIEGAGSPAEINLRKGDIANMGFATAADVPIVLVGDIDRGGIIASLVGTHTVLPPDERLRIQGFVVNRFRGDLDLFADGLSAIEKLTGWPGLGVLPWLPEALRLPAEDAIQPRNSLSIRDTVLKIAVPLFPRIANFDDLDPLAHENGVEVIFVPPGDVLPGDAGLVVLPGSKSTISDLDFLRRQGWHIDLAAHIRRGGHVLGICGGYQMLGQVIADPCGLEGAPSVVKGLGFLDVETVLEHRKTTRMVTGHHCATGAIVMGYEIHLGSTSGPDCDRPFLNLGNRPEGAMSVNGRVSGTYMHSIFSQDRFRQAFLSRFGLDSTSQYAETIEASLDVLADAVESRLNLDCILSIARKRGAR